MKNILKRYWIRDVGRAIFVKQYQVSSSSGLFKFSGSCATQDINREIWCDTRSQVVCWAGSIPRGECECFATWGNVVFWILESGLYLLLPEGKQASKEYQWFQPFCGLPQLCYFHGHLNSVNQSMYGKDWDPGICPSLCICFSTREHQRRKHLENTIRDGRSTSL